VYKRQLYEIAALPLVARSDNQRDFINTPVRPGFITMLFHTKNRRAQDGVNMILGQNPTGTRQ